MCAPSKLPERFSQSSVALTAFTLDFPISLTSTGVGNIATPKRSAAKHSESFVCAHLFGRANKLTARYTRWDNAKPRKEPTILKAEDELRQQGAGQRVQDLTADCLERRGSN
eukprot:6196450-Pleurochrysis_carterae.AAC.2